MNESANAAQEISEYTYKEYRDVCGIPPEYWDYALADYDTYDDETKAESKVKEAAHKAIILYINHLEENFERGKGLYIQGQINKRCGISLLGTYVLRAAMHKLKRCLYREFSTFILDIGTFNESIYSQYYNVDYLMLDSIDALRSMSNAKIHDQFADIISYRRTNKKPIIFCSYQNYRILADNYCQSLLGYIPIHTHIIDLTSDKRIKKLTVTEAVSQLQEYVTTHSKDKRAMEQEYTPEDLAKKILRG